MQKVQINTQKIQDWDSFHEEFKTKMGFPKTYTNNMNDWVQCMSSLRDDIKMTSFYLEPEEYLYLEVLDAENFREQSPILFEALILGISQVNKEKYIDFQNQSPAIALVLR